MAIDTQAARLLLAAQKQGVSFERCITLGRQSFLPGNAELRMLLREYGHDPDRHPTVFQGVPGSRYAEPFFSVLGTRELQTMDASSFEGATTVHDLNQPIPSTLAGRFDVVYDGGTIEHVFNFQTAIRNCMELVGVGGRVMLHTPANNYFGHGFYQFSPELFFRVFSAGNGFSVERMVALEYGPRRRSYEVADPVSIQARTPLINRFPVLLFVQARKEAAVQTLFRECPQQSDYSAMWQRLEGDPSTATAPREGAVNRLKRGLVETSPRLARFLEAYLFSSWNRAFSFRNRRAFRPLRFP